MDIKLSIIIYYINDHIVYGTDIKQSLINDFIIKLRYNIKNIFLLYREIKELKLSIEVDTTSSLSTYFKKGNEIEDNLMEIINNIPEIFTKSDIYLFKQDLLGTRSNTVNLNKKLSVLLNQLNRIQYIEYIGNGKYKRIMGKSSYSEKNINSNQRNTDIIFTLKDLQTNLNRYTTTHLYHKSLPMNEAKQLTYGEQQYKESKSYLNFLDNQEYFKNMPVKHQNIRQHHNDGGKWS
ncbi:hypothetical protein AB5N10_08810 [Weissella paramesenteroides]|uniref:hypothetical protein n=1 Tax=Weissella paramesenteroides TaxID=1249 RepID=UPI00112E8D52|nr:hypothetical protein [Weissella paramesenteroides]MBU7556410.1 hypothetical protein [Weissella paramesenteroides]TPF03341.1 hypothetical protein DIS13_00870 [Weissella paramesenteroides]